MIKRIILCFLLVFGCLNAANKHVRAAASGTASGDDWTNAYTALPGTLVRGNTYYVADGTYAAYTFNSVAGTTPIVVQYATPTDHGSSSGWSDSYSTTTANFTRSTAGITWDMRLSYLTIDGNIDGTTNPITLQAKTRRRGITIDNTAASGSSSNWTIYNQNGTTASNVTLKNCEIKSVHGGNFEGGSVRWNQASGSTADCTFQYNYFNTAGQSWFSCNNTTGMTLEYNWFYNCGSNGVSFHSAGIIMQATSVAMNFTFRKNMVENMLPNTGSSAYMEPQGTGGSQLYVYGNCFFATDATESAPNGVVALTSSDTWTTMLFYNNTIYGLHYNGAVGSGIQTNGGQSGWVAQNNVWQGNTASPTLTGLTDTTNIKNTGGVSFVNAGSQNFRLTADTATTWTSLGSPYNTDMDGVTRTSSVGAFQYVSASTNSSVMGGKSTLGGKATVK